MMVSRSAVAMWERGTEPNNDTLQALADYFNVSVDYLIGRNETPAANQSDDDADLWDLREELRRRPELHVLFSATRKATKEDLLTAIKIIEALRDESNNG